MILIHKTYSLIVISIFWFLIISSCSAYSQIYITKVTETDSTINYVAPYYHPDKGFGVMFFIGQGVLNQAISNYFTHPIFIGINIDIIRNRTIIQIDDYIGFSKTKKGLVFSDGTEWKTGTMAFHATLGANIGYAVADNYRFKLVPIAGLGINLLSSTILKSSDTESNEPIIPYFKLGYYLDIKSRLLTGKRVYYNGKESSYASFRISTGINLPIGNPKYSSYYKGELFYITIGIGGVTLR